MMLATQYHYVLPASVPTWGVFLLAVLAIAGWVASHWAKRLIPIPLLRGAAFIVRVVLGMLAMLAVSQALMRSGFIFATNWPIWPITLVGALTIEIVLSLYGLERRVVSRRLGLGLAALRVALIAIVILMLTQVVKPWSLDRTLQRYVAVLLDNSASMYIPDTQLNASEKMRLARRFSGDGVGNVHSFDVAADTLDAIHDDLAAHGEWLTALANAAPAERQTQMEARGEALHKSLADAEKQLGEMADALAKPIDGKIKIDDRVRSAAEEVAGRLKGDILTRLRDAADRTSKGKTATLGQDYSQVLQAVNRTVGEMAELASKAAGVGQAIDEAAYAQLNPEEKGRVDALAAAKRIAVARDVLLQTAKRGSSGSSKTPPLLDQLKSKWSVLMYEFASKPSEVDLKEWADPTKDPDKLEVSSSDLPPEQQMTDMTEALAKVTSAMSDKQLSGILLLTDGRHNGRHSLDGVVQGLAAAQVPVSSIVFGGSKPPMDAGIISVDAPETIAPKDRVLINSEVKLDGLAGQEVRVTLSDGAKTVSTQTVRVPTDSFRTRVQFSDEPAGKGLHTYTVEVQHFDGEVLATNNKYPVTVNVSEEKVNLLLIDGRPRWEFRYLKNLFSNRDKAVRLQYVLLEPDKLEGVPAFKPIEASASRPDDEVEATALPKDEAEWMKFDVIILGDVAPKYLSPEQLQILQRFVEIRSGTLIVISGPQYMPHAYIDTPLAKLLPVVVKREERSYLLPPERSFRIGLTSEGRQNVMLRMEADDDANMKFWNSLPDIYWRHPVLRTLEGATVLAYAVPTGAPDFIPRPGDAPLAPEKATDEILRQRTEFERANPLIAFHSVAMGQVMFLGFDYTWRLRYRTGDTYHHRFWGQIMRWAGTSKLPSGTDTIRLGAERTRYGPQSDVRVRAKLGQKDYTPINNAGDVLVNVYQGDKLILSRKMEYIEHSPGMYVADLGEMAQGGAYRVELSAPEVRTVLAQQGATKVETEFSIDPSTPLEQAELVPDRGLLQRVANLTGGLVTDPSRADRVLASFGAPTKKESELHEFVLWDSWPLLVLALALATTEWLLRKKGGLA